MASGTERIPGRKLGARDIALMTLAVAATIGLARWAADFIVPVVAGILLAYAVEPLVGLLTRIRIPRGIAASLVLTALVGTLGWTVYALRNDAADAVAELPEAARRIREAIHRNNAGTPSPLAHVQKAAAELDKAAAEASGAAPAAKAPAPPSSPVTTELSKQLAIHGAALLGVLGQILVAVTLAFFLLTAGDAFRRKLVSIVGPSLQRRRVTVEILNEINVQVQRYLLNMFITNALLAAACAGAYAWLGLDRAALWGVVAGVLHFIPYVGAVLGAAAAAVAALLQTASLTMVVEIVAVTIAISLVLGMGFNTWLQGRSARMNAVAVFVSVLFFGWLWGGWGLLLGAPLAAVAKTVADRIEALRPFGELLGEVAIRDAAASPEKAAEGDGAQ